ncbi:PREDICTED: uncharacterized protein LOC104709217 [Camelina sativa]|uniref:Uncharacterized protein LOC104709217 n=1 Tax=Camelina sativa TaxID=90675 RepID=A0ABM0TCG3_CAMSA|nr:PREDICTED: uncharacterized protein LOC104709217 [Camelina sativa]
MWRLWITRNDFIFQKISRLPEEVAKKGKHDACEWFEANYKEDNEETVFQISDVQNRGSDRCSRWSPPPRGWLKCNFDSGYLQNRSFTNTGWLFRDSDGKVILSGCAKLQPSHSSLQAEALGFLHVLQIAWAQGLRYIWFESDNKELITLINNGNGRLNLGTLLFDIRHWMAKLPESSTGLVDQQFVSPFTI